ncbi:hypothetical protein GOODEAATRI_021502, partial [Goodea atripinnis]
CALGPIDSGHGGCVPGSLCIHDEGTWLYTLHTGPCSASGVASTVPLTDPYRWTLRALPNPSTSLGADGCCSSLASAPSVVLLKTAHRWLKTRLARLDPRLCAPCRLHNQVGVSPELYRARGPTDDALGPVVTYFTQHESRV